jgi:ABC-2 type transport system permease protein
MSELLTGMRLQLSLFRRNPGHLLFLVVIPFFSAIFLAGVEQAGKDSLASYAVLAPAMIGLWTVSLDLGGSIIDTERIQQTFELQVLAPGSFSRVLVGRVLTITGLGMVGVAESILFARVAFGVKVSVSHPIVLVATLVVTALSMAGTAAAMAAVFIAARAARRFANSLSYPFYILGGVLVPTTLLPVWVRPLGWFTYLYWTAGLLRASLSTQPVAFLAWRLLAVLGTGLLAYVVGRSLIRRVINVLRREGTIGLS